MIAFELNFLLARNSATSLYCANFSLARPIVSLTWSASNTFLWLSFAPWFLTDASAILKVLLHTTLIGVNLISIDLPYSCGFANNKYESTWSSLPTLNDSLTFASPQTILPSLKDPAVSILMSPA